MLDALLLLTLLVLSIRGFLALRRESAVLAEFGQSHVLSLITLLYPLGPVIVFGGRYLAPYLVGLTLAASLYALGLVLTSRQTEALERAGTDRVKGAMAATSLAGTGAIVGVIYVSLAAMLSAIIYFIGPSSPGT